MSVWKTQFGNYGKLFNFALLEKKIRESNILSNKVTK